MSENNDKIHGGEIVIPNGKAAKFLDNIWYHYKWHIIIISFFVTVFAICFVQCATTPRPDVLFTYAGGYAFTGEEKSSINQLFSNLISDNAEEKTSVAINPYTIYTEDELYKMYFEDGLNAEQSNAANSAYMSAKNTNITTYSNFSNFLMTGESAVLFISEWVYTDKMAKDPERMVALDQVFDQVPTAAYDAYAIRLSETDIYKQYDVLKAFPEDTLIILLQPTFAGTISHEDVYALHKKLFSQLALFQAK